MTEQIPEEVKHDRIERLIEVVQQVAASRNAERVGRVEEVLVESPSRTDPSLLRGRTRRNTTVNFSGSAAPGDLVDVRIEDATSTTLRGVQSRAGRCLMRILVTGSSGQIGTNLGSAPAARGTRCVRRRQAAEHLDGRLSLSAARPLRALPSFPGGIGGVEYPPGRSRCAPGGAREGAPARSPAAPGAREHDHDLQRARVLPPAESARSFSRRAARSTATCTGFEEDERGERRLRLHGVAPTPLRRSPARPCLLVCALLRPALSRLPLLERLRALRQRSRAAWCGSCRSSSTRCSATSRSRSSGRRSARLHLCRRLHRRHHARDRRAGRGTRGQRDDQPGLREGNTLVHVPS